MSPLILVVDDEPQIQTLMELILKEKGYQTAQCLTGEKAIEMMNDLEFNLVILDLNLPCAGGREVAEYVEEYHPHTPIIFITGAETAETMALKSECTGREDRHFMYKPIMTNELYDSIEVLINQSLKKGGV